MAMMVKLRFHFTNYSNYDADDVGDASVRDEYSFAIIYVNFSINK